MTVAATSRPDHPTQHKTQHKPKRDWSRVMRGIGATDFLVITWAVLGAQLIRFGPAPMAPMLSRAATTSVDLRYSPFSAVLIVTWLLLLKMHDAYDHRVLGHGPEEYKAVATASFRLFAVVAVASYVLRLDVARGYVAMAMPAGMIGLLVSRWLWRKWLTLHRAQGLMSGSVLVVGDREHLVEPHPGVGLGPRGGLPRGGRLLRRRQGQPHRQGPRVGKRVRGSRDRPADGHHHRRVHLLGQL